MELAPKKLGLPDVTGNIDIVNILLHNDQFEIYIAGGQIRNRNGGNPSAATCGFDSRLRIDCAIISESSVETNGMMQIATGARPW